MPPPSSKGPGAETTLNDAETAESSLPFRPETTLVDPVSQVTTVPTEVPTAFIDVQEQIKTVANPLPTQPSGAAPGSGLNKVAIGAALGFGVAVIALAVWWLTPVDDPVPEERPVLAASTSGVDPARPALGASVPSVALPPAMAPLAVAAPQQKPDAGAAAPPAGGHPRCLMKLTAEPEAEVSLDGTVRGTTPLTIGLPAGPATVSFTNKKLGLHRQVELIVPALPQASHAVVFGRGWLEVDAPKGSLVAIDGRGVGTAPLAPVQLYEGRHSVDVRLPGGKREAGSAEVRANETVTHFVSAPPAE